MVLDMTGGSPLAYACCNLDSGDTHDTSNLRCQFDDVEVVATYDDGVVACKPPSREESKRDAERQGLRLRVIAKNGKVLYESVDSVDTSSATQRRSGALGGSALPPPRPSPGLAAAVAARSAPSAGAPGFRSILGGLSWLDRLLPLWIVLAMALGILLSVYVPSVHTAFSGAEWEGVSIPLAVGLIVMMIPPLCKVQWEALPRLLRTRQAWLDIGLSLVLNWIAGPLLMLGLAWAALPDLPGYRTGVILVGLARCIAMVLIWNGIARGNPDFCALLVIINSLLQMALYAPLALLYCSVIPSSAGFSISYSIVARSVGIYLGIPLAAGAAIRAAFLYTIGKQRYEARVLPWIGPWALIGLLYTIVVIFGQQGDRLVHNPGPVFRTFVPLTLYFAIMWTGTFALCRWLGRHRGSGNPERAREGHAAPSHPGAANYAMTVTQSFTAASNNFELSIAVAAAVFGADSDQALAATVGPLLEVPILLALSYAALWLRGRLVWEDVPRNKAESADGLALPATPAASLKLDDARTSTGVELPTRK